MMNRRGLYSLGKLVGRALVLLSVACVAAFSQSRNSSRVQLIVDKSELALYVISADKLLHAFPVSIGKGIGDKQREWDYCTPEGEFTIAKIHNSTKWVHDFKDGNGKVEGAYGPWFLRLDTGARNTKSGKSWKGIGIHGTHDTTLKGMRSSEGCVRLRNQDVHTLRSVTRIGDRVLIRE